MFVLYCSFYFKKLLYIYTLHLFQGHKWKLMLIYFYLHGINSEDDYILIYNHIIDVYDKSTNICSYAYVWVILQKGSFLMRWIIFFPTLAMISCFFFFDYITVSCVFRSQNVIPLYDACYSRSNESYSELGIYIEMFLIFTW